MEEAALRDASRDSAPRSTEFRAPEFGELRSVGRALDALEALAASTAPMGVTEVADRLGIAPSSAHRLLSALCARGYAIRSQASRRYRRGPALIRLVAHPIAPQLLLRELAHPVLARVARETGETAHLAVLDGLEIVGVDHVIGGGDHNDRHADGARLPAHATALGLAILAFAPEAVAALTRDALRAYTPETVTDAAVLRRSLEQVRRRGYAVNVGGWNPTTAGVAATIRGPTDGVLAGIAVTGPIERVGRHPALAALGPVVHGAARELGEQLRSGIRAAIHS
ncbi:MAG TPA: IclR family transcriptional regulator [Candidatus Limnocylindrales bacterium]|nr:IclR family transcriptional regulator [Candidatus Limnocylindrales bacterium]